MEPGIYADIPHADYLRWDACSASRLENMRRSPAYCRWQIDHPEEPTDAMVIGTALHMAILEPERFDRTYECLIHPDGRTRDGKADMARILEAGRVPLKPADWGMIQGMWDSVAAHPIMGKLLDLPDCPRELSILWEEVAENGVVVQCKARADFYDRETCLIVDLKSSVHAHPAGFPDVCYRSGYHRTAAHYLAGFEAVGLPADHYAFLANEKTEPYECAFYDLEQSSIEVGRQERKKLLEQYAECLTKNQWPAYPTGVLSLALPEWAIKGGPNG